MALFITFDGLIDVLAASEKKAYEGSKKMEQWEQCSRDLQNLGLLYDAHLNDATNAMICYREALRLAKQSRDTDQLAAIYNNIGKVMWRKQRYREALDNYQKGLAAITNTPDTSSLSDFSLTKLKRANNDRFISTLLAFKSESLLDLFKKERDTMLLKRARSTFRLTDRMIDHMRWQQSGEPSKLYWRDHTQKWYENAIEVCYLLGDVDGAFFFLEKSRAVMLNDKLNELGAQKLLAASDLEQERSLRVAKTSYAEQLAGISQEDDGHRAAMQNLLDAQHALDRFIKGLETRYPAYYRYKYDTTAPSLELLRNTVLQEDVTFLSYLATETSVYVLAVTPEKSQLVKVDYSLHDDARRFLQICSDKETLNRNYSSYLALAHKLYDKLIKPLDIPTKRIIISQDEHFFPFEALISDTTAPPKVSDSAVRHFLHLFSFLPDEERQEKCRERYLAWCYACELFPESGPACLVRCRAIVEDHRHAFLECGLLG